MPSSSRHTSALGLRRDLLQLHTVARELCLMAAAVRQQPGCTSVAAGPLLQSQEQQLLSAARPLVMPGPNPSLCPLSWLHLMQVGTFH